jgi:hypothetical protein
VGGSLATPARVRVRAPQAPPGQALRGTAAPVQTAQAQPWRYWLRAQWPPPNRCGPAAPTGACATASRRQRPELPAPERQRIDHWPGSARAKPAAVARRFLAPARPDCALGPALVLRRGARALLEDLLRRHVQGLPLRQGLGPLLGVVASWGCDKSVLRRSGRGRAASSASQSSSGSITRRDGGSVAAGSAGLAARGGVLRDALGATTRASACAGRWAQPRAEWAWGGGSRRPRFGRRRNRRHGGRHGRQAQAAPAPWYGRVQRNRAGRPAG